MSPLNFDTGIVISIPIPGVDYSNVKMDIHINEIDPDGDVPEQVTRALLGVAQAIVLIDDQLEINLAEIFSGQEKTESTRDLVTGVRKTMLQHHERINAITKQVQKLTDERKAADGEA